MSLVAYDNSDESDYEEEDANETTSVTVGYSNSKPGNEDPISDEESVQEAKEESKIFQQLPQPSKKKSVVAEEDDEFLHKKEKVAVIPKPKAKISVPSLSDFKDVEGTVPISKPRTNSGKKSGLLSMLPQPRNVFKSSAKPLIPQVVSKMSNGTKTLPTPSSVISEAKAKSHGLINDYTKRPKTESKGLTNDSDESDDDVETDFFSINKQIPEPVIDEQYKMPEEPVVKQPRSIESFFKTDDPEQDSSMEPHNEEGGPSYEQSYGIQETSNGDAVLDEEAIMKLCGTRGKRKREEIQIVDVNQQEVLAEAKKWLMKGIMDDTSKRVSSSKRKGHEITSQQKRKHQITYLAHQAKANEAELQNQWANNRMSKRQTQSKYGF